MSRRPRDSQQPIPSIRNSAAPTVPPIVPSVVGSAPTINRTPPPIPNSFINIGASSSSMMIPPSHPSSAQNSVARTNPSQQLLNQLQLQSFINDKGSFQNFDLASLGEIQLCDFLSQAIDLLDSPVFLPTQPTHSRFVAALVRCLNTMPWGRVFTVATVPANLPIESSKHHKLEAQAKSNPGTFLFKLPSSNRSRAYPTNMHDLHAFAKTTRRKVSALFALLTIKLANFSPSSIPDILSATLQYFQHLPPTAQTSMDLWFALPATFSEGGGATTTASTTNDNHHHNHNHNHQHVPSSSAPSSCRAYASALTTWLDNEIDTPMFRVLGSLLARYEEYSTQGSIARNPVSYGGGGGGAATAQQVCLSVLERSIPKKRWPVIAHHLTWFSVMGKFFQIREVEAVSKAMGELESSQNSKYASPPLLNASSTTSSSSQQQQQNNNNNQSHTTMMMNSASSPSSSGLVMRLSASSSPSSSSSSFHQHQQYQAPPSIGGNPSFANLGTSSTIQHRHEAFIVSEKLSSKILQYMLDGLLNLETLAKLSRENSYGARRCASILVDSIVAVGLSKMQMQLQQQSNNNNNNEKQQKPSPTHTFTSSSQTQQQQQQENKKKPNNNNKPRNSQHQQQLVALGLDIEDMFPIILRHYLENVIVFSGQSVCCSHAVPLAVAIGLDYVCIHAIEEGEEGDENNNHHQASSSFSCVRTLVTSTINRLGKSFSICSHSKLFEEYFENSEKSGNNTSSTKSKHHHNDNNNNKMYDIHPELLALSHLASVLKSLVSLAQQSPEFLQNEVLIKLCFHHQKIVDFEKERGGQNLVKSLKDIASLLKKKFGDLKNNNSNDHDSEAGGVARWLYQEVLKPFCETFQFEGICVGDENDENNTESDDDGDEDDDAARIEKFFSKQQQEKSSKKNASSSERKFEVLRQPEIAKKIWRSYQSFMKELLPFSI